MLYGTSRRYTSAIILPLILSLLLILSGCSDTPVQNSSDNLTFSLPDRWAAFEHIDLGEGREHISFLTSQDTLVTIERNGCGPTTDTANIRDCVKRYVNALVPEDENNDSAQFTFGEAYRAGLDGMFVEITRNELPTLFLEVYRKDLNTDQVFIIINTPKSMLQSISTEIDSFLSSISK